MKTLKFLLFICVAASFSQCNTLKLTDIPPFNVGGASYHNWVGGQPGVRGTNLIIAVDHIGDVEIKSVFFREKKNSCRLEQRKGKAYLVVNMNMSKRMILVKETIGGSDKNADAKSRKDQKKVPIPFTLRPSEAVIHYMVGKKSYYYKVSKIKKTETIFYP